MEENRVLIDQRDLAPGVTSEEAGSSPVLAAEVAVRTAPYGSWLSPITAELVAQAGLRIGEVRTTPGGRVYWVEGRPDEGGRNVVVRWDPTGRVSDVTPKGFEVRSTVHEYGGGAFSVFESGGLETVVFSNLIDGRLYRQDVGLDGSAGDPMPLTPEDGGRRRYADFAIDESRGRALVVCEDHGAADAPGGPSEPVNFLASIGLDPHVRHDPVALAVGHDFYSSPRVSPDGGAVCFLAWDHPNMPWFGCALYVSSVGSDGTLEAPQPLAGGDDESVFQPEWSPSGRGLYFVSDRETGWWNLFRCEAPLQGGPVERVTDHIEAEFGTPQWSFGMSLYDIVPAQGASPEEIVCAFTSGGVWRLGRVVPGQKDLRPVEISPFTDVSQVRVLQHSGRRYVTFLGGAPVRPTTIVSLLLDPQGTPSEPTILRTGAPLPENVLGMLSEPVPISFETFDGGVAYALYYPPTNRDFVAPANELPPVLVKGHGGPTASASTRMSLGYQYWTSRGVGILDVNYGGSSGYGRAYRFRLHRQWGVVDVEDFYSAALRLVGIGKADPKRLLISGGSAGGYSALRAITMRSGVFAAAASHYGIADLEALARDTHKFESRYLDWLVGPYPAAADVYKERSPIHHVEKLGVPVAFFHGSDDRVVPVNQAETMVDALRARGVPVGYIQFEGERHGFRRPANVERVTDAELFFYSSTVLSSGLRY